MFTIKTSTRLALTIGCIFAGVIWVAVGLRIVPNPSQIVVPYRIRVCEALAMATSSLAESHEGPQIRRVLEDAMQRNPEIQSVGLRDKQGNLLFSAGPHTHWNLPSGSNSSTDQMRVTISNNRQPWADLEIRFTPLHGSSNWISRFPIPLLLFGGSFSCILVWIYLSRILKYLNPSKVVPSRVRSALDSLAEGLILTDPNGLIVLANEAFCKIVGKEIEVQGRNPATLGWSEVDPEKNSEMPWVVCYRERKENRGRIFELIDSEKKAYRFIVNSTPVFGEKDRCRGVLTSFDDITVIEQKQNELMKTLKVLQDSRNEIKRQNRELQILASVDPLSGCLNRRSFFERFQVLWSRGDMLSAIMVDIDHFKAINDNHGHAVGDAFIRATGELLREQIGNSGLVCRYGGEEFCILLFEQLTDQALKTAWSINRAIAQSPVDGIPYTASVGVSSRELNPKDVEEMLEQADRCLYVAKRQGRDRAIAWNRVTEADLVDETVEKSQTLVTGISEEVVNSLLRALAYRDRGTAEHSRRVANMCVEVATGILEEEEVRTIEVAALLHDVGKIGVPDAVLLKAGPLNDAEWRLMHRHDEMSHEIVRAAQASEAVCEIIRSHHERYGHKNNKKMPSISARIVSVCDAFDAMTNDRVYRRGLKFEDAYAELRRNAGKQFDPTVVELVIDSMKNKPQCIFSKRLNDLAPIEHVDIESQVVQLQNAIHERDVEQIPSLLHQLIAIALADEGENEPLMAATDRLQNVLQGEDAEFERLLSLTEEILALSQHGKTAVSCHQS
jgi:diguanylate cyclase (GGDEF)-like protein/PAS domain S-box-containing protein/putative nucleotidyltransferase with HDIG domain